MAHGSTIILTTGQPGAGKSYARCARFLVDDFLINSDGVHWSSFPLYPEVIAEEVARRSNLFKKGIFAKLTKPFRRKEHKVTVDEVLSRIKVIPEEVLVSWRNEESGPWDYFNGVDLQEAHIAIDEIHNFVSSTGKSPEYIKKWDDFLGEVRHRGCTVEALTQDMSQVHRCLKGRAGVRIELVPSEAQRDPFLHIQMSDWYELRACFTGEYRISIWEKETLKGHNGWCKTPNRVRKWARDPFYFKFYNSYNKSLFELEKEKENEANGIVTEEKEESNRIPRHEYEKRTKLGLLSWFFLRNFFSIAPRFVLVVVMFWICFCGGAVKLLSGFTSIMGSMAKSNSRTQQINKNKKGLKSEKSKLLSSGQGVTNKAELASSIDIFSKISDKQDSDSVIVSVLSIKQVKAKQDELKQKIIRLKEERKEKFRPAFISPTESILRNGLRVYVGYVFKGGEYDQRKVKFINCKERCLELDNGDFLRM